MTQGGRLGSDLTDIGFESLSHDGGTISFDERNFTAAWGLVINSSLTVSPNYGIASVTRPSAGLYEITFSANIVANANYVVVANSIGANSICIVDSSTSPTSSLFRIRRRVNGGALTNGDFMFMVVGGQ